MSEKPRDPAIELLLMIAEGLLAEHEYYLEDARIKQAPSVFDWRKKPDLTKYIEEEDARCKRMSDLIAALKAGNRDG